ncbi:MAG: hypothetical protein UT05_C0009G0032 [Parcubacteria group bacterium GW2011_GWF2_38_76]|nr:MAG: hypothetical protein UT05_C0009G0032 [Parcubacteria group bacterium GW2011_GWF2_38_76]HBM45473.1 hypothetical protein [Patescibacteria group bacterium]
MEMKIEKTAFLLVYLIIVVIMASVFLLVAVTEIKAQDSLLGEDELIKIVESAKTHGDFSYIGLENFYLSAEGSNEKVLQILNKFSELKRLKVRSFYLNKDYDSTRLFGIYIVHDTE